MARISSNKLIMEDIYNQLTKGVRRSKNKTILILCGGAGVGKTTLRNKIIEDSKIRQKLITVSLDELKLVVGSYRKSKPIVNDLLRILVKDGYSILHDGSCRDENVTADRIKYYKSNGYKVILGIVYASLETVINRVSKRTEQPMSEREVKGFFNDLSKVAESYINMDNIDEVYLYNNENTSKLIFYKKEKQIHCKSPETEFYFDVSKYC